MEAYNLGDEDDSFLDDHESFNNVDNSTTDRTVKMTVLNDVPIATLTVNGADMLCLAQISATILAKFSYNEIHNRRVALSISTKPCNASQMELLRCAGAVPPSSRRCGLITRHEAERLVRSFTEGTRPPALPPGFAFEVVHECGWGCQGRFYVEKYTSSRAKCIECLECGEVLAPNKFIFHSHRPRDVTNAEPTYRPADAANFNSWRRHIHLNGDDEVDAGICEAWEDVKALFNGGNRQNVNVLTMTTLVSASVGNPMDPSDRHSPGPSAPTRPAKRSRTVPQPADGKRVCSKTKMVKTTESKTISQRSVHQESSDMDRSSSPRSPNNIPSAALASNSLQAGANLLLLDTLLRSFLMPQSIGAQTSPSPLPLFPTVGANEIAANPTTAEQLAALNFIKQKAHLNAVLARQSASPDVGQLLMKSFVRMNDNNNN